MELVREIAGMLWEVWKEMFSIFIDFAPKAFMLVLWIICAIVIIPCVYVAGNLYPKWQEWGEGL